MILTFEQLLAPIGGVKVFEEKYRGKDHFVIRFKDNPFADHFNWTQFSEWVNSYNAKEPKKNAMGALQIVKDPVPGGARADRWCRLKSQTQPRTIADLNHKWRAGKTFVMPIHDRHKKMLWEQCRMFEEGYYGPGQANIYLSPHEDALVFPAHVDSTDNFLFHIDGKVDWTMYKEYWGVPPKEDMLTIDEEFTLEGGDMLYIPRGKVHKTRPSEKRLLISYHFSEPTENKRARKPWLEW